MKKKKQQNNPLAARREAPAVDSRKLSQKTSSDFVNVGLELRFGVKPEPHRSFARGADGSGGNGSSERSAESSNKRGEGAVD